ncbi:N-(5'-phosphoribosyl)anthranilate isomerase [Komagataeibacter nataicola]|uniref:N-(5'-phosphoribosyl)anthranilate isomerase n=1 Tax=Komagataeibacter nataicola TaxID=265960 RepID=A0A9N7C8F7_9PROT|nr:phosphoribosylanthranilate isomerase [Komagataeibacter nataicola]AQU87686.1 N-(5'-phosphoribosyl)anthranilate isomerase [Komagataeibacter nataicola]PYD65585.1 N-(5'-phosphoribosyl)anthranilate isomerase [Komagataeibacter nataicola]WEQ55424.1 phosphoribosylanthranilate isomerase [Komagataeibacter nataicola]GBR19839.1 phosphoribosyl anthranilate isomerase [Komagataeibacter nataicola NRIC 0616]
MTVRVKICGIRDGAGLDAACAAGADWVGFVFFSRSPRHVTAPQAAPLVRRLPHDGPRAIGLFVRPTDDEIRHVLDTVALDGLQIYDTATRAAAIRVQFGVPVWLAAGIAVRADLPQSCAVDGLVIESRPPAGAQRPGGNARTFDWSLTEGWQAPAPWMLAGGLRPGNVREAVRLSGARAVDVSSGVETAPGVKSPALIHEFVRAAHGL